MNTVAEIHNAVDVATEFLLKDIVYPENGTVEALKNMGFTSSLNVIDASDHKEHHGLAKQYQDKYPLYKFITLHQLNKVLNKYDLMAGLFSDFMGEIPAKNISDLKQVLIYAGDIDAEYAVKFSPKVRAVVASLDDIKRSGGFESIIKNAMMESLQDDIKKKAHKFKFDYASNKKLSIAEIHAALPECLMIAADPVLFKKPVRNVCPMPYVAVKGGILILTAWGNEANDPDVKNERMN